MLVVIVYDIRTGCKEGKRRLRCMEKISRNWGIPVQNSVVECYVNEEQFQKMKLEIKQTLDPEKDSVRCYRLGNHYQNRVETLGREEKMSELDSLVF